MLKNIAPCLLMILACTIASTVYAGKVELTTYYPAPSGEYDKLQSKGSCVGTGCVTTDVTNDNLVVKGKAKVQALVITQGTPASPEDGQIWIQ